MTLEPGVNAEVGVGDLFGMVPPLDDAVVGWAGESVDATDVPAVVSVNTVLVFVAVEIVGLLVVLFASDLPMSLPVDEDHTE